ncbi:MAG: glucosamine-6-phosphate deaminase [Planctomycetota bacterium]
MKTHSIETIVHPGPADASRDVANRLIAEVHARPNAVLGLATGGTPVEAYRQVVEAHRRGEVDFGEVRTFNLDEYVGLAEEHPQSFRYFMQEQLFDHLNIKRERTQVPDGLAADIDEHCASYETKIRDADGIDLQLLGIGHNGHIAFNEPGSSLESRTRSVTLTAETIEKNARFFDSPHDVPRFAITMGIGTILEARRIVLLALGEAKADAVEKALYGPVTESHPASLLQMHPDVTFVLDAACARGIDQLAGRS